jgi:Cohesin domain/Dockerin type I domain
MSDPTVKVGYATVGTGGGAWSVGGLSSDGVNPFMATGNTFTSAGNPWKGGEAIIRIQPGGIFSGNTTDYWAPTNWQALDSGDTDLGGTGAMLVDVPGATPSQLVVAFGKDRNAYVLNRNNLGGIAAPVAQANGVSSSAIIQAACTYRTSLGTYVAFRGSSTIGFLRINPTNPPTITTLPSVSQNGRGSPFVTTTDGVNNAIVWAVGAESTHRLMGYNGDTGAIVYGGGGTNELMTGDRRFNTGIAARGSIYFAGDNKVFAFRLAGGSTPTPTATPTNTSTNTPTATATNTSTPTNTPTPTNTSTPTATDTPTATPTAMGNITGTVTYGNAISGPPPPRAVPNVLISGAGSVNVSTTGFPDGSYFLTGFGEGPYTVTPTKTTGQNGITSFDAARIAQHVAGINPFTGNQLIVADVSGNGSISSFDSSEVAKYVTGVPPFGNSGNWIFDPPNRTYPSVTNDIPNQDYSALLMGEVTGNWSDIGGRADGRSQSSVGDGVGGGESEKSITVSAARLVASADHEVIVPVTVDGAADKGIISYEFDLKYDPSVIQPQANPVDVVGTVSRGLMVVANTTEPGLLKVAVYGPMPIDSNGVLFNLRFSAVGTTGVVSPLVWERIMFNEGLGATVADGQVELSAAAMD